MNPIALRATDYLRWTCFGRPNVAPQASVAPLPVRSRLGRRLAPRAPRSTSRLPRATPPSRQPTSD